jgi:hypothetical protein
MLREPTTGELTPTLAGEGLTRADILAWLREDDPARLQALWAAAVTVTSVTRSISAASSRSATTACAPAATAASAPPTVRSSATA